MSNWPNELRGTAIISISGSGITVQSGSITNNFGAIRTPLEFGIAGVTGSVYRDFNSNVIAITGSTFTNLTYDVNGNIITVINTVLGVNYTGSISYDASGNLISIFWSN